MHLCRIDPDFKKGLRVFRREWRYLPEPRRGWPWEVHAGGFDSRDRKVGIGT
jgi:hypothetical protein